MENKIEFYFDFGSPNCYLAYRAMPKFLDPDNVVIKPVLLGGIFKATGNASPIHAFANIKGKLDYEMLELRRFVTHHHLNSFQMNPHFPINTLHLMRMLVAVSEGRSEFIGSINAAMWEDGKNMDDPEVVGAVLMAAGFDAARLFEDAQNPEIKQKLIENTEAAVARGVFGLPAFFVGDEMYFGKDRLRDLAEHIAS